MNRRKLNIFQKLTLQWDALHPYNAAQLMHLDGPANSSKAEEAWRSVLHELGLGISEPISQCPPNTDLEAFLTDEMNRPFAGEGSPFRPFILPAGNTHYLGVVYHHWVADSVSIRLLLREWFLRIYEPAKARRTPLTLATSGYWKLFGTDAAGWDLGRGLLDVFRWSSRLKRARRIESKSFPQLQTRFRLHRLPDGLAQQLVPLARAAGGTLNDFFLAAMAQACDQHVAAPPSKKRNDLALGVIVDLRSKAAAKMDDTFGLFLGFTSVLAGVEDLRDWNRLVAQIAKQNRQHKQSAVAESSMLRMVGGLLTGRLLSSRKVLEFYRKRLPLAAGISNVNLNPTWVSQYHPSPILEYIRVSPTGPMLPLVFTPTTLGQRMHFGLTHRVSVIDEERARLAANAFANRLTSLPLAVSQ